MCKGAIKYIYPVQGNISANLRLADAFSFVGVSNSGRHSGLARIKSFRDVDDTSESDNDAKTGEERHYHGPIGHIVLGFKILFLAPFVTGEIWICDGGLISTIKQESA